MDMKIRTMATLLGTWLAESRRSSALLLSVLLCLGATSASAVTWDYEPGTGTITGFTGLGSQTVTQVNTAAGETLRAVSVNDNMGGTVISGSTPYAGSDSLFSSANYNGETSVTFSLVSGKQFDLTSIAFTEFFAISETITLTSSKGTASYFLSAGGSATFNVAGDANAAKMQGITSFTVTASPTFFAIGFDNIVLVNITSPASAPIATTGAASSISATGATLNGTVNGNGASTTVTYDYGLTTGYGTNVAATTGGTVSAGAGNTATSVAITGLSCNTTYHFRVKGVNSAGTTNGSDASFTTSKCPQTITFNNPGAQNFGTTPTLSATATSGLTVSFTSSTTGVCTITSGGALTFVTAGTCTINADQAGNSTYLAASTVSRSFSVNAVAPGAPTIGTATAGDTQASISFSAPASNGGASITGYTATANPGGVTGTG
ncbi:MAG: adhesin, partial [Pseudomonadota bacterium]